MRVLPFLLLPALASAAAAQVTITDGISPNVTNLLDFDAVPISTGPIANDAPVLAAGRIESVSQIGSWSTTTDVISPGANDSGRCLVVGPGGFEVAALGDPVAGPSSGAGIELDLDGFHDEFGLTFVDQANFDFEIELFRGIQSIGSVSATYSAPFPIPPVHVRGPNIFNRVRITFPAGAGGVGFDNLHVGTGPPVTCVETALVATNSTGPNGTLYFDVTCSSTTRFTEIETLIGNPFGEAVGMEVYRTPGTFAGQETNPGAWTRVAEDNGLTTSAGPGSLTRVTFLEPFNLPPGTTGIALVATDGMAHTYGLGSDTFTSVDGLLSVTTGSSSSGAFAGGVFSPRTWSGRLCPARNRVGVNPCSSTPNSTGAMAELWGFGSDFAAANDLTLVAFNAPENTFGQFLCGMSPGSAPGAGGSQGVLCLSLPIGRLVGGGVIMTNSDGVASVRPNLRRLPQPTQLVPVLAGERWYFQFWFRDVSGGSQTSNYSESLAVTFQ